MTSLKNPYKGKEVSPKIGYNANNLTEMKLKVGRVPSTRDCTKWIKRDQKLWRIQILVFDGRLKLLLCF